MRTGREALEATLERELRAARREGYLMALAQVEAAVYQGQEALFKLLASAPKGA